MWPCTVGTGEAVDLFTCPEGRPTTPCTKPLLRRGSRQDTPSLTTWTESNRRAWAGWTWPFIKVRGNRNLYLYIFNKPTLKYCLHLTAQICPGKRWSTASAYLRPALGRPNLTTEVRCLTTKILFDGNRAVGVEYTQDGQKKRVRSIQLQIIHKEPFLEQLAQISALPIGCLIMASIISWLFSLHSLSQLFTVQTLMFPREIISSLWPFDSCRHGVHITMSLPSFCRQNDNMFTLAYSR